LNVAAAPVIVSTSFWRGAKAGLYRATHWPKTAASTVVTVPEPARRPSRAA